MLSIVAAGPIAALLLAAAPAPAPGPVPSSPAATSPAPAPLPVPALVDRVVEAYGGKAALERWPVVVQEGEVAAHTGADVGRLTRILERSRRLRVTIGYPGGRGEQRILDGDLGWRDGREVTGTPAQAAMILQAARMELPLSLLAARDRLADEGVVDRDGKPLRALTLPLGNGLTMTAEIDESTGRILRTVGRMPGGVGSLEFVTTYGDFRKVAGTWAPFREENHVQGRHSGTTTLFHVEHLPEAPTGAFRP
ncbi:MAG TPA: hypothetical protein VFM45_02465 [Anaeromyxobacteraceae bacterium]|nr:hypothetical protein [Anaeromyxobacteraceae bacterium]